AGQLAAGNLGPFRAAAQLLPYQRDWVVDDSPLKIAVKGRQTGYSFAATLRAVFCCLKKKTTWIFLSKGERQSHLLMEKVQDHVRFCGMVPQYTESAFFEGTLTKQLEVRFPNGSVIYGLPANPDTARGYSGNVTLDEFAFHADAGKIYTALYPIITRGFGIEVISTPNGQQGKFYELAKAADLTRPRIAENGEFGRSVASPQAKGAVWSGHWCDIHRAAREGMRVNVELLRSGVDDETWRQEFCCEFISAASEWISAALFQSCVSSEASTDFRLTIDDLRLQSKIVNQQSAIYAGWDIARNRDLSVIWLSELVGDVTWTRGVIEMRNVSTPDQVREARALMPCVRRMNIDQSGMGLSIAETLAEEFPGKVEGVQFTQHTKEAMAVLTKRRMEERKVRIPGNDNIRTSFRGVKKTATAVGQARFDAEHDTKFGHADHWWAFCLAEAAAGQPAYRLSACAGVIGTPVTSGMREMVL
ncbi:MAG: terminase large subunit domain-containing protein, partial [Terriglobia bacterium]